jgi:hypothetical protein
MRLESFATTASIKTLVIQVIAVTLIWVLFYRLSLWVFSYFEYNPRTYWIFLPAGIRIISVFIFGWVGVLGLFIGSIITNESEISGYVVNLAAISALAPMVAKQTCMWGFNIKATLEGLTGKQLLVFAFAGALSNALFSNLYFYLYGVSERIYDFLPMFIGDLAGTIIILYLSKGLLALTLALHRRPRRPA